MENEKKVLFSKVETAFSLGISKRMVDILISKKLLRATAIGRRRLIHRREIERLAREGAA